MSRFRFARMTDEREEPALFGLIGAPKARIGKESKIVPVSIRSRCDRPVNRFGKSLSNRDSAGFWDRIGMRVNRSYELWFLPPADWLQMT